MASERFGRPTGYEGFRDKAAEAYGRHIWGSFMEQLPSVLLVATMDTKYEEALYLEGSLKEAGISVWSWMQASEDKARFR